MRSKKSKKKPHKKKSFKKKSKKTIKSKNKKNIDGMLVDENTMNNPYFQIGLALGDENNSKCDCGMDEISQKIDEINKYLDDKLKEFEI